MAGERITEALAQGRSVVYDTLNDTRDNRDRLRRIAQVADADSIVVFTNTPLPLIRKRQQRNEVTRERHSVSTENFQEALDRFEAPDASAEFVLEFTPDDDFSVWREQLAFRHTTSSAAGDAP